MPRPFSFWWIFLLRPEDLLQFPDFDIRNSLRSRSSETR